LNNIQIFNNQEFGQVRWIEIDNKPYAVAVDVARALGYKNTNDAVNRHCKGVVKHEGVKFNGGTPSLITESDVYRLITHSELPGAEKFESWVFDEILPSIRKTGMYATEELLNNPDLLIAAATRLKEERAARLKAEETIKELAPAAEFGNAVGNCQDAILIRDFSKVMANAGIKMGQDKFFSWLHVNGYIYRDKSLNQWMPYQKYVDMGLFKVKETAFSTNTRGDKISYTIKITGKGQRYFFEKLKESES
jgi:prophage antirepressor-like protein